MAMLAAREFLHFDPATNLAQKCVLLPKGIVEDLSIHPFDIIVSNILKRPQKVDR